MLALRFSRSAEQPQMHVSTACTARRIWSIPRGNPRSPQLRRGPYPTTRRPLPSPSPLVNSCMPPTRPQHVLPHSAGRQRERQPNLLQQRPPGSSSSKNRLWKRMFSKRQQVFSWTGPGLRQAQLPQPPAVLEGPRRRCGAAACVAGCARQDRCLPADDGREPPHRLCAGEPSRVSWA